MITEITETPVFETFCKKLLRELPRVINKDIGRPEAVTAAHLIRTLKPLGIVPAHLFDQFLWSALKELEMSGKITEIGIYPTRFCAGLYRPVVSVPASSWKYMTVVAGRQNPL